MRSFTSIPALKPLESILRAIDLLIPTALAKSARVGFFEPRAAEQQVTWRLPALGENGTPQLAGWPRQPGSMGRRAGPGQYQAKNQPRTVQKLAFPYGTHEDPT